MRGCASGAGSGRRRMAEYTAGSVCGKTRHGTDRLEQTRGGIPRELFDGVLRCKLCGKEDVLPGYKLCRSCYEKSCESLKVARAARGKNELWDRLNSLVYLR